MVGRIIILAVSFLLNATMLCGKEPSKQGNGFVEILNCNHKLIVDNWLIANEGYRLATEKDCRDGDGIKMVRRGTGGLWKPVPNYQPYYVVGDFNADGEEDFAVAVVMDKSIKNKYVVLIFNGPFDKGDSVKPAFVSKPMDLSWKGMFFGLPRPKPHYLIIAPFESEGVWLLPKGKSYEWEKTL